MQICKINFERLLIFFNFRKFVKLVTALNAAKVCFAILVASSNKEMKYLSLFIITSKLPVKKEKNDICILITL